MVKPVVIPPWSNTCWFNSVNKPVVFVFEQGLCGPSRGAAAKWCRQLSASRASIATVERSSRCATPRAPGTAATVPGLSITFSRCSENDIPSRKLLYLARRSCYQRCSPLKLLLLPSSSSSSSTAATDAAAMLSRPSLRCRLRQMLCYPTPNIEPYLIYARSYIYAYVWRALVRSNKFTFEKCRLHFRNSV